VNITALLDPTVSNASSASGQLQTSRSAVHVPTTAASQGGSLALSPPVIPVNLSDSDLYTRALDDVLVARGLARVSFTLCFSGVCCAARKDVALGSVQCPSVDSCVGHRTGVLCTTCEEVSSFL